MMTECVEAPPAKRRTPRSIVPLVTPVAANMTSPEARSSSLYLRSRSATPMRWARARSLSLRNSRRPCIWPPMQRNAAAASTPSGAPPEPTYISMPVSGSDVAMTPLTSPSPISAMRAPAARTLAISSEWRGRSRMQTTRSAISAFFACARFLRLTTGSSSRSTTSSGSPPPTAILSIYTSGALRKPPASAMAMTARALAPPLAVIVVPSSGSSAISIGGPFPVPTFSPIKSIGASSRSPSPMTTVPAIDRLFSASRIASTAAWSAAFSSPRPIHREAESAAASVTRTASSARLRSIFEVSGTAFLLSCRWRLLSKILDADHVRRLEHGFERLNLLEGPTHCRFDRDVGRQHHRHGLPGGAAALNHRFHRYLLVAQGSGDIGDYPRLVQHHQSDVIGALMPLDRHAGESAQIGGGDAERGDAAVRGDVDEIGGDGRGGRQGTRAATFQHPPPDETALGDDRVENPLDRSDRRRPQYHARVNALLEPLLGQPRNPEELDAVAEFLGKAEGEPRAVPDPLGIDPIEVDRATEPDARQDGELVRRIDAVDVKTRIGFRIAELLRLGEHFGKFVRGLAHRRQDIIGGPVENAVNAREPVSGKTLAQGLDHRYPAGDGSLEGEDDPLILG